METDSELNSDGLLIKGTAIMKENAREGVQMRDTEREQNVPF